MKSQDQAAEEYYREAIRRCQHCGKERDRDPAKEPECCESAKRFHAERKNP